MWVMPEWMDRTVEYAEQGEHAARDGAEPAEQTVEAQEE